MLFLPKILETVGRILAIDYGKKRIGLAVTDPMKIIANKLATISTNDIWDFLKDYFQKEQIECIVVGYPRQMNNQLSDAVLYINPFLNRFRKLYPEMPLELMDERFTSKMAFQTMIDAGLKKKARQNKGTIDTISATIILQSYMEQQKFKR